MWGRCTPPPYKHMQTCNPVIFFFGGMLLTTYTPLCELPPLMLRRQHLKCLPAAE